MVSGGGGGWLVVVGWGCRGLGTALCGCCSLWVLLFVGVALCVYCSLCVLLFCVLLLWPCGTMQYNVGTDHCCCLIVLYQAPIEPEKREILMACLKEYKLVE